MKIKSKGYIAYAIGEILLIVVGILLALYINNRSINQQYKNSVDNNIIRVFHELEKNIDKARNTIETLEYKDSLIYLVMHDSVKVGDYDRDPNFAFLILQNHSLSLEDKAYQNLISLNVSDNTYNDELLVDLKELYSLNEKIKDLDQRMANFVTEKSIPLLARNIESFGDLTYKQNLEKEALHYFMNSSEYRSHVAHYAIIAIRNQLSYDKEFYKTAIDIYGQISELFDLENKQVANFTTSMLGKFKGVYVNELKRDTLNVQFERNLLFLTRPGVDDKLDLIPISEKRFFVNRQGHNSFFVSFNEDYDNVSDWNMNITLMSTRMTYKKVFRILN